MPVYAFEGKRPTLPASTYVAPSAVIIGRVVIGERCYVGPGAILRGDYGNIEIGDETAIEEGVIVHARPEDWTRVGRRVTVGHGAMIHNATIRDGAVIGMRAVVSDFSVVDEGAVVGEMTLVKQGQTIPPRKVAVGVPARVVKDVDDSHRAMTRWAKELYVALAGRYIAGALEAVGDRCASVALPPLRAIGIVRTPYRALSDIPAQAGLAPQACGEVVVDEQLAPALADVQGFSHLLLIVALHRARPVEQLTVIPRFDDVPRGLFATRSPQRPNPIGLSLVRLLRVEGNRLQVAGIDLLDGTPLLDIKPYVARIDTPAAGETVRCGWTEGKLDPA